MKVLIFSFFSYFKDMVDKAYQHFNAVLRNDPDHKKAMLALKVTRTNHHWFDSIMLFYFYK